MYNLAISLFGGFWYYHHKNLASQTGLNQSSASGYTLHSVGQHLFAEWPLYLGYSDSAAGSTKVIHLG